MTNKKQWEQEYLNKQVLDCPWCGHDRPDHSCSNCYSEMNREDCWKHKGYCSEKCLRYIEEELPALRDQKIKNGIKCRCDKPLCAKCLSVNCTDKNCPTHSKEDKIIWRKRWEQSHNKKFPHSKNF